MKLTIPVVAAFIASVGNAKPQFAIISAADMSASNWYRGFLAPSMIFAPSSSNECDVSKNLREDQKSDMILQAGRDMCQEFYDTRDETKYFGYGCNSEYFSKILNNNGIWGDFCFRNPADDHCKFYDFTGFPWAYQDWRTAAQHCYSYTQKGQDMRAAMFEKCEKTNSRFLKRIERRLRRLKQRGKSLEKIERLTLKYLAKMESRDCGQGLHSLLEKHAALGEEYEEFGL